jgi:hypothetical protein
MAVECPLKKVFQESFELAQGNSEGWQLYLSCRRVDCDGNLLFKRIESGVDVKDNYNCPTGVNRPETEE